MTSELEAGEKKGPIPYSLTSRCAAEGIATFFFCFLGTMQTTAPGNSVSHAALTHGLALFVLITSIGHISGGHVNPAVSLAATLVGRLPYAELPAYVGSQLAGGVLGVFATFLSLSSERFDAIHAGACILVAKDGVWNKAWTPFIGLLSETTVTAIFIFVVLGAAVDRRGPPLQMAPLVVGLAAATNIYAVASSTGISMNPARAFSPHLIGHLLLPSLPPVWWLHNSVFFAGSVIGTVLAVGAHKGLANRKTLGKIEREN